MVVQLSVSYPPSDQTLVKAFRFGNQTTVTVTLDQDIQVRNNRSLAGAGVSFLMTASPATQKVKGLIHQ